MLPRRIALLASACLIAASAVSARADADPLDDACAGASPSASVCIGGQKLEELGTATVPGARGGQQAALDAYAGSWLHRTAQFQYALGNTVALRDAQWLGTHNSFNSPVYGPTLSRTDSNQQLTITQQLQGDIRSLELDVHHVGGEAKVCHGRGADQLHAGCTTEGPLRDVLAEIAAWLDAHDDQVLLLYLEDHLGPADYADALAALDATLGPRLHRANAAAGTCRELPLELTRADVLAAGANVLLVGRCRAGWGSHVFGWDQTHEESGSSAGYACPGPSDRLIRFYEDSTWLSAAIDPAQTPAEHRADALTPDKVAAMTACGVNLFGFDQFHPGDGRVEASIWSWAPGEPRRENGACTVMRADGRWYAAPCDDARPRADAPRTGEEAAALRAAAGGAEVQLTGL